MLDIFFTEDIHSLLKNKSIVFMGDSNIRALYKDCLCLLDSSRMIPGACLRAKMENSVFGDTLTYSGLRTNGRDYKEERSFQSSDVHCSFYFLTQVYNDYVQYVLDKITRHGKPDILILNCCLWDITRWGANGVEDFKRNLTKLMKKLKTMLPDCLVIWVTAPPISQDCRGGFLLKELEFIKYCLRFHVVEANHFARKVVALHGFDIVDSHYHLQMQIHRRIKDGIHWDPHAVRLVTNLLFTHISLAWNVPLPHRYQSSIMEEQLEKLDNEMSTVISNHVKNESPEKAPDNKPTQTAATRKNKENFASPQGKKKRQRKSKGGKKPQFESHHAYMSRTHHQQRQARIRQWKNKTDQSPSPSNSSHDSGYLSPNEVQLSNDFQSSQRSVTLASPQVTQINNYLNSAAVSLLGEAPWGQQQSYGAYCAQNTTHTQQYSYTSPYFQQGAYVFPHVAQGQTLQPRIDFTSDTYW